MCRVVHVSVLSLAALCQGGVFGPSSGQVVAKVREASETQSAREAAEDFPDPADLEEYDAWARANGFDAVADLNGYEDGPQFSNQPPIDETCWDDFGDDGDDDSDYASALGLRMAKIHSVYRDRDDNPRKPARASRHYRGRRLKMRG